MKMFLAAVLILSALTLAGRQSGLATHESAEFIDLLPDGPYSALPTSGPGESPLPRPPATSDSATEIISEAEALRISQLLDMLAGDPIPPLDLDTALDGPTIPDTSLLLAGL